MRLPPCVLPLSFALTLSQACGDDRDCTDEIRIAVDVDIAAPSGVLVSQVTVEKQREELCGTASTMSMRGATYQCWEQRGGGSYQVRVYAQDGRIWSQTLELESEGCHIRERKSVGFDLSVDPE